MFSHPKASPIKKNSNQFARERILAVLQFAQSGKIEEVREIFLQEKNSAGRSRLRKYAVLGFAQYGNSDYVNEFSSQECDFGKLYGLQKCAIRGFAQHGHIDRAYTMFNQEEHDSVKSQGLQKAMMAGFAQGTNFMQINKMISQEKSAEKLHALRQCVVGGLEQNGHIKDDEENLLTLISNLEDLELKKLIIRKAKKSVNEKTLLAKAQFMTEKKMNYDQIQAWIDAWSISPEIHTWFLQVRLLLREQHFVPLEIFLHISSFILAKPNRDVERSFNHHFSIVPQTLFAKRAVESEEEANEKLERRLTL